MRDDRSGAAEHAVAARVTSVRGELEPPPATADAPTRPNRRWRRVRRSAKLYWKTVSSFAVSFAGALAGVTSAVAIVWIALILVHDIMQSTITIADIAVPEDLSKRGFTPAVVAGRLRDALNAYGQAGARLEKHAELALPDDTTQVVVPTLGLPLATVASATSKLLHINNNRSLTGELTVRGDTLFLRLRLNDGVIYENSQGVNLNDPDRLFNTAARAVYERTEPYTVAAYLYNQNHLDQVYDETSEIIARLPATDPNVVEAYYLRGYLLSVQHHLDRAVQDFRTAIRLDPSFLYAHDGLAGVYEQQHQQQEAANEFRTAVRLNGGIAYPHVLLGNYYWRQGKVDAARDELQTAVAAAPENEWVRDSLGDFYRNTGARGQAIAQYRTAVELTSLDNRTDDKTVYAHLQLGNLYNDEGRRTEAGAEFTAVEFLDPRNVEAHTDLADLDRSQGNRAGAVREYGTVLRLDPNNVHAHTALGDIYDDEGKRSRAVIEYRIALRLDPKNVTAHNNLGALYAHEGRYAQAVDEYHTALRLDPSLAVPHANLGGIARQEGRNGEAEREYRTALRLDPSNAQAHSGMGDIELERGQQDAAADDYRLAVRADQRSWDAHLGLGKIRLQRGDYRGALAEYDAVIKLSPMNGADAYLGRGEIAGEHGDYAAAIANLSHAIELAPRNAQALSQRALAFVGTGQVRRALADAGNAIRIDRSAALGYYARASVEQLSGDASQAKADFARAIAASGRKRPDPHDSQPYLLRGIANYWLGNSGPAVTNLTRVLAINPNSFEAYMTRSAVYFGAKDYARSLADINRALTLAPGNALLYLLRSEVHEASRADAFAVADATRSLALSPTPDAFYTRGDAYDKLGNYRRAIDDLSRAIGLHFQLADAFAARSVAFLESGDYRRALADANSALANSAQTNLLRAELLVGEAHFALHRFAEADDDFLRSVRANPQDAYAALWLQLAHWKLRDNRPAAALSDPRIDVRRWPGPVVRFFAGNATAAEVFAAAARGAAPEHGRTCEAAFYVGEYALAHADPVRAHDLLKRAAATCAPSYSESIGAKAELAQFAR